MKNIVIVEDDRDLQHIFKSVLQKAGYTVQLFSDGQSMVHSLVLPDIFILDIELPVLSGLQLCQQLKADARTSHIPVLLVSASATLLTQAKDACADAALEKPFDGRILVERVKELLAANTTTT